MIRIIFALALIFTAVRANAQVGQVGGAAWGVVVTPTTPVFTAWTGQVNSNGTNTTGCPATPPPGQTFASCLTATKTSGTIAAGDCVVVFVNDSGSNLLTVVDDNSTPDQFSSGPAGFSDPTSNLWLHTYYLLNAPGGGSHIRVAEINNQATIKGIVVAEASNCGKYLDPATATGTGASSSTAGTSITSGSMTTSVNGDLIIGVASANTSTTSITPGSGFTGLSAAPTSSGSTVNTGAYSTGTNHFFIETEWRQQTTAGSIAATFTSGSDIWAGAAIAITPVGYSPPALTLVQSPVTIGDNTTYGSGGNGQQCVWHIPAIGTGHAVVGYLHSTDVGDAIPMAPDYINVGSTAADITPSVQWSPYGEDITYFYLTGITGNPTTVTVDFPSSDGGTLGYNSCNIGLAEYTGVGGFTVTNPALISGTTTIATSVAPSVTSRVWAQAAIVSGYPSGISGGYNQVQDDWLYHGIGAWQSGAANLTGPQTVTAQLNGAASGVLGAIALQTAPSESPFNGSPFAAGVAMPASQWDLGGVGLAFQATNSCGIGYYTSLGSDRLNVYQNSDPSSSDGLSIGCNQLNDYHNYTINVTTSGTYQVTLRVGNIATGATYNILGCTTAGQSCTTLATGLVVPNTGAYTPSSNITSSSFSLSAGAQVIQIKVSAVSSSGFAGDIDQVTVAAPGVATITGVTVAGTTSPGYTSGATSVGAVGVSETGGTCSGSGCTLAICEGINCTGGGSTDFSLSSTTLPSNLNIASGAQTCSSSTPYYISIAATQSGSVNSGNWWPLTVTCNSSVSASGTLTLTNGPPNIPEGTSGSCTTATCTWIESGISGEAVSDVYFDESPMSTGYQGTFSLGTASGCSSAPSNFAISQDNYNDYYGTNHHYAHITTTASLSAGDTSIYVCAGSPVVSQQIVVHAVSGYSISSYGGCNASGLSGASSAAGSYTNGSTGPGGIVLIPASCSVTLSGDMNPASNNQVIIGAGPQGSASGGSTFNGNGNNSYGACVGNCESGSGSPTGDALMNIEFTGATLNCTPGNDVCKEATQTNENWVIRNMYYHDNDQGIADKGCGAQIYNTRFVHNAYNAFHGTPQANCPTNEPQIIAGSEWTQNGFCGCDNNADAGQKWINANAWILDIYDDYAHQNYEKALWMDTNQQGGNQVLNYYDSTVIANGDDAIHIEQGTMTVNVYNNFFLHNDDNTTSNLICNTTCQEGWAQIVNNGSSNSSINNNYFLQIAVSGTTTPAYVDVNYNGNASGNNPFYQNTVTFLQAGAAVSVAAHPGDVVFDPNLANTNPSGTAAYGNQYHLAYSGASTANDQHWNWGTSNAQTFSQWTSSGPICNGGNCTPADPDTLTSGSPAGTIDTSSADVSYATGCTHVACSSAGIGTNGKPTGSP